MQRPNISLSAIQSDGPQRIPQSDGSVHVKVTPCFVCDGTIEPGEWISKVHGRWAHRECAQGVMTSADTRAAWALIGEDIARRPRAYSTREIRTVVGHLVELVHRDTLDEETP